MTQSSEELEEKFWDELDAKFQIEHGELFDIIYGLLYNTEVPDPRREEAICKYVTMARDMGFNFGYAEGTNDALSSVGDKEEKENTSTQLRSDWCPNCKRITAQEKPDPDNHEWRCYGCGTYVKLPDATPILGRRGR